MEVRTSTMPLEKRTGVDPLAWNSSQEIPQQQENLCSVVDELLFPASISTAQNWTSWTCALFYRTARELSNLKCSRRRPTTWNLKLSGQQQEPTLLRWISARPPVFLSPDSDAVDRFPLLYTISIGRLHVTESGFNLLFLGVIARSGASLMSHRGSVVAW